MWSSRFFNHFHFWTLSSGLLRPFGGQIRNLHLNEKKRKLKKWVWVRNFSWSDEESIWSPKSARKIKTGGKYFGKANMRPITRQQRGENGFRWGRGRWVLSIWMFHVALNNLRPEASADYLVARRCCCCGCLLLFLCLIVDGFWLLLLLLVRLLYSLLVL